jgi:Xaa-Pro aminopeptidase
MRIDPHGKPEVIRSIQAKLSRARKGAFLLSGEQDIKYLSSFYSKGAMLLVPSKGRPLYFIDNMNRTLAEKKLEGSGMEIVSEKISPLESLVRRVKDARIKSVVFDDRKISLRAYRQISKKMGKISFSSADGTTYAGVLLDDRRKIKSPEEIRILRKAARETVKIWAEVKKGIRPGMTEIDIARMVDGMVRAGGRENSFPTIAAIGANSAYPHAIPTGKKLKKGEHVLIDFGIRLNGYCSDLTRIWAECRINRQIMDFYGYVRQAHDKAIEQIRPGATVGSIVSSVNDIFKEHKAADHILHGLGHGIGLDVHEEPFLRAGSGERLKEGMVFTVEPGLYFSGLGGIRVEDMVLVTAKGHEVLTV